MIDARLEEMILSAALLSKEAMTAVAVLPPDTFTSAHRMDIHTAIREQFEGGVIPSVASVYSAVHKDAGSELLAITGRETTSAGWEAAVSKALSLRSVRRIMSSADMVKELCAREGAEAAIEFARSELVDAFTGADRNDFSMSNIGDDVLKGVPHLPTGIEELDAEMVGIPLQYCVTIAARPSIGKTALGVGLAANWALKGIGVHYFSLEMPRMNIARRIISAWSGVDGTSLRTGRLIEADRIRATAAWERMKSQLGSLCIDDKNKQYSKIFAEAHKAVHQRGCRVIMLDHAGLVKALPKRERRDLQVAEFMARCAEFAKANDCVWINLFQLVRGAEGEKPVLSDIRESGAVEQDSDMVILLHRDRANNSKQLEVNVAKFRDGKVLDRTVQFDTATMKIGGNHFAQRYGNQFPA